LHSLYVGTHKKPKTDKMREKGQTAKMNKNTQTMRLIQERMKARRRFANASARGSISTEVNRAKSLVIVVFLVAVGISCMTAYSITAYPQWFGNSNSKHTQLPGQIPMLRSGSVLGSPESAVKKANELEEKQAALQCTESQMNIIRKQLPATTNCQVDLLYKQECSQTKATTKGCHDPIWAREFFAALQVPASTTYQSLFVDYLPNDNVLSDFPMDALHFGSHKANYDVNVWRTTANLTEKTCKKPITFSSEIKEQSARSVIFLKDEATATETNRIKEKLELTDRELWIEVLNTGSNTVIRKKLFEVFPDNDPIHYVKVSGGYNFLASWFTSKSLSRAWYLEFVVDWKEEWTAGDASLLLKSLLPKSGFTCYWAGSNGNLWRINGCWQDHYSIKSWSNVACVNTEVEGTKPLLDSMEQGFEKTLSKDHTYGWI
jgi:hypothetical protein